MNQELEKILKALDDAKLMNICLYDLENTNPFYNYVFVSTASNKRQLQAALRYIDEAKIEYRHVEGKDSESWILIDCDDVIINVFSKDGRELYDIDSLYYEFNKLI